MVRASMPYFRSSYAKEFGERQREGPPKRARAFADRPLAPPPATRKHQPTPLMSAGKGNQTAIPNSLT
jgi:hypothetical protein